MKTICFTGHRPNKLYGYDLNNKQYDKLTSKLVEIIMNIINDSNDTEFKFIFGGTLGIDQLAFQTVHNIVKENTSKTIILEIAIPFHNQPNAWYNSNDINRYNKQLQEADIITNVDTLDTYMIKGYTVGEYYPAKMQKRNQYMVDNSDIVIAVYAEGHGGTYNCIQYAKKLDKEIIYINPKF